MIISFTLPGVTTQGDRVFCYDAQSLALGSISSVLENGDNPASVGLIDDMLFSFSAILTSLSEKRGLRVYDSYGNNTGISTISSNSNMRAKPAASTFIVPLNVVRVGVKYYPLWDFTYFYQHEYRDDFFQITKIVENRFDGYIYSLSPVIGLRHTFLNVGIQGNFLFGHTSVENKIIIPLSADTISTSENSYHGTTATIGFLLEPNIHFRFAYSYTLKYTLEGEEENEGLTYPTRHTIGFLYQPAGRIPTKFLCEIRYETWDKPIFMYNVGVEHTILGRYAMRYGFCIFPDYTQRAIWTTTLTIGFGLKIKGYHFDFGYGYGKRDYGSKDFGMFDFEQNVMFDESMSHFVVSSSIYF